MTEEQNYSLGSDREYLARLAECVARGAVTIECEARHLRGLDSPVAVQAETERWAFGLVIVAGVLWWFAGMWAGIAALAVAALAYVTIGKRGVARAIDRRVREKALHDIELWRRLWRHGGVRLRRVGDPSSEPCAAPEGSWIRFTEAAMRG